MNRKDYIPCPADTSGVTLAPELLALAEELARNTHDVWALQRAREGWVWGPERNDALRTTPCMAPYEELPETEKEYDRLTSQETLRLILSLGWRILPPEK